MPFDFINLKTYSIDYDTLFESLKTVPFLENQDWKEQYLSYWKKVLIDLDANAIETFNTPEKISDYNRRIHEAKETEIFQQEFTFSTSKVKVYFHYRISIIFQILAATYSTGSAPEIELADFTNQNTPIKWSKVPVNKNRKFNNEPVFLVPFLNGQYKELLIDGNHRVSQAIELGKKKIKAFPFHESSVIDFELFCHRFDLFLYVFQNEINHFANHKAYNKMTDEELLEKSYLLGNGFQF